MTLFVWFLLKLCCCTIGGPVHRTTWSIEDDSEQSDLFHRLPVFLHAPRPLIALEVIRPVHQDTTPEVDLTALLLPPSAPQETSRGGVRRAVEVWCGMNSMSVRLDRLLLRAWPSPSRFRLGFCGAQKVTPRFIYFHYGFTDCDVESKVVANQLTYSNTLFYDSLPQSHVIRVPPLNLPIHCQYNRFHYSYKIGFRPEVHHTTHAKTLTSKLVFSLTVCNAQWEAHPPSSSFLLGEQLYFIAQVGSLLAGERLYVDSCYATSSKDQNSMPKVYLITNYGCMMDSMRESSSSQFLWRRANELRFSLDAFLFKAVSEVQYLHCSMSVGLTTTDTSKTCNYNQAAGRWEELDSSNLVCSCCDSVCKEKQHSIKHTSTSKGWQVKQNVANPRTRISIPAADKSIFVSQVEKKYKEVNPDLQVLKFQRGSITEPEETKQWKLVTAPQEARKEKMSSVTQVLAVVDHLEMGAFNGLMSDESRSSGSNWLKGFNESKNVSLDWVLSDSDLIHTSEKGFNTTTAFNLDTRCNTSNLCSNADVVVLSQINPTPNSSITEFKAADVSIHPYNKSAAYENGKN